MYFTIQYCIEYSSTIFLFQAQDVRKQGKSSGDVAGTAEVTEFHDAGNGKGIFFIYLFEKALLVFEAQDPKADRHTKVAAAVQNAIQCYHVTYDEKKRATTQTSLDRFFKSR